MRKLNTNNQAATSHQSMRKHLEKTDAVEGIRLGLAQMERGEGRSAEEVFAEFRRKHHFPNT